jgi:hypothetical protein
LKQGELGPDFTTGLAEISEICETTSAYFDEADFRANSEAHLAILLCCGAESILRSELVHGEQYHFVVILGYDILDLSSGHLSPGRCLLRLIKNV